MVHPRSLIHSISLEAQIQFSDALLQAIDHWRSYSSWNPYLRGRGCSYNYPPELLVS